MVKFAFASMPLLAGLALAQSCPDYGDYSKQHHEPFSSGKYQLSSMRPQEQCRTFRSDVVEQAVKNMSTVISDPDLYRLFENCYPNTLDTAIKWHGHAADNSAEELTFIITGDITAMWLRDSANQMQSYLPLLQADAGPDSIAGLYRGVINLQARYLLTSPFCNSFQPPVESGIPAADNNWTKDDNVKPKYDRNIVFECKYELDSLAAFLQISAEYWSKTGDVTFFSSFKWIPALKAVLETARVMRTPTYGPDGNVLPNPYTFSRLTDRASETLYKDGCSSPVSDATGLVRSAFRPSDDATIYQFHIPANMQFAHYLMKAAEIVKQMGDKAPNGLATELSTFSQELRAAIERYGVVPVRKADGKIEEIYAYEVDGFGGANTMDDANVPSLLSAPFLGFVAKEDEVYQRTRRHVLSHDENPYYMRGPVINAIGGPHVGPGMAWPMANIIRILTTDDDAEITTALREIVSSTDGLGLIHESINTFNVSHWSRQWFSWANGLFGYMVIDLADRKPEILRQSFQ